MFWVVVVWMGKGINASNASVPVSLTVASDGVAITTEVMAAARNNVDRFFINYSSYKIHNTEDI
jgi:hypothetical protein